MFWKNIFRNLLFGKPVNKPRIHFSHANGLPASTYSYLFEMLEDDADFCFVEKMGHGRFAFKGDWSLLADELIDSIESQSSEPVIGMGHSLGAVVTLLAATKRPELFSKLILLDPVLFCKRKRLVFWLAQRLGLRDWLGPVKRTLTRRSQFDSAKDALAYFSPKTLFKNFHPRCLNDYVKHGLKPVNSLEPEPVNSLEPEPVNSLEPEPVNSLEPDCANSLEGDDAGLELAISPLLEADIFRSVQTKAPAGLDKVKGVMIYGDRSKTLLRSDVRWWRKNLPNVDVVAFAGEHLFPLESPEEVARVLREHING
jgi:pimeloyl-ACP methyl ester carboxylesterase